MAGLPSCGPASRRGARVGKPSGRATSHMVHCFVQHRRRFFSGTGRQLDAELECGEPNEPPSVRAHAAAVVPRPPSSAPAPQAASLVGPGSQAKRVRFDTNTSAPQDGRDWPRGTGLG